MLNLDDLKSEVLRDNNLGGRNVVCVPIVQLPWWRSRCEIRISFDPLPKINSISAYKYNRKVRVLYMHRKKLTNGWHSHLCIILEQPSPNCKHNDKFNHRDKEGYSFTFDWQDRFVHTGASQKTKTCLPSKIQKLAIFERSQLKLCKYVFI